MPYRYWRVSPLVNSVANSYAGFSEVAFLDSSLNSLVPLHGGTAFDYDTAFNATYNAPKAFDSNSSTYFSSKQNGIARLGYHFSVPVDVVYMDFTIYSTYVPILELMNVQVSDDALNWQSKYSFNLVSGSWVNSGTARLELVEIDNPYSFESTQNYERADVALSTAHSNSGPVRTIEPTTDSVERFLFGGTKMIKGNVSIYGNPTNTPVSKRVVLYNQKDTNAIDSVWSDPITGYYEFKYLADGRYMVVAYDDTRQYNAEIVSDIVPIDMG